ncbi:hypothetical protein NP493_96g12005 [Ridgeia piscesae]|uniref:Uncharacterized protein n=1 Tax=Ridgeia piscesae TaxID=27915 RepID=A0AAD9P837_RIDPI|nr:hypothetical protein NP493_96g12005 [Ridgeia piscesae]
MNSRLEYQRLPDNDLLIRDGVLSNTGRARCPTPRHAYRHFPTDSGAGRSALWRER